MIYILHQTYFGFLCRSHLLWQGSPDWRLLAIDAFHVKRLAIYFSLMIALQAVMIWDTSLGLLANLSALSIGAILATVSLSLLALTAWLSASTTMYTITNRRVVMRIGIVLSLTFNLPFARIAAAQVRRRADGSGDLVFELLPEDKIAYAHLWPHARPWRFTHPQPMLRSLAGTGAATLWSGVELDAYQSHVNTNSKPSELKITDMRIATVQGAPMTCPLIRIDTNQGIYGLGEVRDGADARFALFLKSRLLGLNPCNVELIFKIIKMYLFI